MGRGEELIVRRIVGRDGSSPAFFNAAVDDFPSSTPTSRLFGIKRCFAPMIHFLFVAGALRERSSVESAELQLTHELWGLRTALIRDNLQGLLTAGSCGLVYVLKAGICAHFRIVSSILPFDQLDDLLKDELRNETRFGFIRIQLLKRWESSPGESQALLQKVLRIPDQAELARRLNLGMHALTQEEYEAILKVLG